MDRTERLLWCPGNRGVCGAAPSCSIQLCCGHLAFPMARKGVVATAVGSAVPPAPHEARETSLDGQRGQPLLWPVVLTGCGAVRISLPVIHPSLLALLHPSPPAQVRPACLPMYGQRFQTGRSCFITGFGKTRENEGEGGARLPAGSSCPAVALEGFPAGITLGIALPAERRL